MKRSALSVLSVLLLGLSAVRPALHAQADEQPVGVAVKIRTSAVSVYYQGEPGELSVGMPVLPSTAIPDGNYFDTNSINSAGGFSVPQTTVQLEPGKLYDVSLDGVSISSLTFYASTSPGYQVEINGVVRKSYKITTNSSTYWSYTGHLRLRVLGPRELLGGRAGTASSIASGRLYWQVALGALKNGNSAGSLALIDAGTASTWTSLFKPAGLQYESPAAEIALYRDTNGDIRQILANEACVDVVTLSANSYELRFYPLSRLLSGSTNPRSFSGFPFVTHRIEQVGSGAKLKITSETRTLAASVSGNAPASATVIGVADSAAPIARTAETTLERTGSGVNSYAWTLADWNTAGQSQLVEEARTWGGTASDRTEAVALRIPSGATAATIANTYHAYTWGEELVSSVAGSTNAVTTSYDYYTDSNQSGAYSFVKSVSSTGGSWEAYDYYDSTTTESQMGAVNHRYRPFNASPASASFNPASGEVVTYDYALDPFGMKTRPTLIETSVDGTTVAKSTVAYTEAVVTLGSDAYYLVTAARNDYSASSTSLASTTRFFREDTGDAFFRSQIYSVTQPDGVRRSYAYQRGDFTASTGAFSPNASGTASRIAVITGTTGSSYTSFDSFDIEDLSLVDGKSTLAATIRDDSARIRRTETYVWSGSAWQLVGYTNYTYDLAGNPIGRIASNNGTYGAAYAGEQKTSETDEAGLTLSYTYDAAGRIDTTTRAAAGSAISALTTRFTYDAADRVTQQTVGYGLSETLISSRSYDDAGRLSSESAPGPNGAITTTYSYNPTSRQVTATLPNGGSRTETYQPDGTLASITGSAVIPQYHTYSISSGLRYARVNLATSNSSRFQETWTDWLARTTKTSRPGFTGQAAFEEELFYDVTTGRLNKATRSDFASTLYGYDALSQPTRSGLDLNGNNTLDLAGADRINDSDSYFEYVNSAWWLTKVAKTYASANSSTATTLSITRQRLTGFSGNVQAEAVTIDVDGNTATRTVSVDRANKTTTVSTTMTGIANVQSETYLNGFVTSATGFDGLTYTHGYDTLGRRITTTAPRTGTTTTTYKSGSTAVWYITDPASNTVVTYTYDNAGRVTATNTGGKIAYTDYNTRDQIVHQWGAAAYPVEYGYNSYGERTTMTTYRGGSGWTGSTWPTSSTGTADTTTWSYDVPSGLLASKTDASGKAVDFTYNRRGRTQTRTWARRIANNPANPRLATTYAYAPTTGELTDITYNDASYATPTPSVHYTYTRTGQFDTVADAVGTRSFVYNSTQPLRLDAVSLPAFYGNRVLTRQYDSIKRPAGFLLGTTGNLAADLTQTHGYHATTGRFDHLDTLSGVQASRTFTYSYNSGGLVSQLTTGSAFTVTRGYESNRNLLTSAETLWSSTSRARYAYTYNVLAQRITAKQTGDVFADFGGSTYYRYVYNDRGELTEAVDYQGEDPSSTSSPQLTARRFGYAYDNLGNRQNATRSLGTGLADLYQANSLNQYSQRENDLAYVAGTARADSTVAVTGGTASSSVGRAGRYWGAEITLANTASPAKADLTITATLPGNVVRSETRTAYLPASPQTFAYDDDGNLIADGLWNYTYDAENRLVMMTATTGSGSAVAAGFPNRQLEFKYDYLNRRVQKRSLNQSGSPATDTWRRFLYDGDALVAEFDATSSSIGSLLRSYTWGLDLTGSLSATGGVGALLQITDHAASASYFPAYDGNGNIAALLRASDGVAVAKYEYSPFGELLRAEGAYAASNPFRFSTKFTDDESGLAYYGARYYSPSLGRFINRDPIAEQGGLNLYGFCGNDGVNTWDVLGMETSLRRRVRRFERPVPQNEPGVPNDLVPGSSPLDSLVVGHDSIEAFKDFAINAAWTTAGVADQLRAAQQAADRNHTDYSVKHITPGTKLNGFELALVAVSIGLFEPLISVIDAIEHPSVGAPLNIVASTLAGAGAIAGVPASILTGDAFDSYTVGGHGGAYMNGIFTPEASGAQIAKAIGVHYLTNNSHYFRFGDLAQIVFDTFGIITAPSLNAALSAMNGTTDFILHSQGTASGANGLRLVPASIRGQVNVTGLGGQWELNASILGYKAATNIRARKDPVPYLSPQNIVTRQFTGRRTTDIIVPDTASRPSFVNHHIENYVPYLPPVFP